MNRFLRFILSIVTLLTLSGCTKNYEKLSYTDYQEYFDKKLGYTIQERSDEYEINIRRYLEAGNGNVQVYYVEYAKEEDAIEYIKNSFSDKDGYKVKLYDNYSYVKNTSDNYQKLYRVDNIIINVFTPNKKYKKEVNNILRDLGY